LQVRIVLIIAAALLPPLCMQAFNEVALRDARAAEVREQALREARGVAADLDRLVAAVRNALVALAEVPSIRSGDAAACARLLASVDARLALQRAMALVGGDGRTLCASGGGAASRDRAGTAVVRLARERGRFVIGEYEPEADGPGVLAMGYPVPNAAGPAAVLVADIDLGWLREQILAHGLPSHSSVTVADRNATYLVRLPNRDRVGRRLNPEALPLLSAAAPAVVENVSTDGVRRVVGFVPLAPPPEDLFISVGISTEIAYAASDAAARRGYVLIAAGFAAALLLAGVLLRDMIARPLLAILATTDRWSGGDTSARVALTAARSEFGRIALAVNGLLDAAAASQAGLRERLAELDAIYRSVAVGLGFYDRELRYVTVNARLAQINGVDEAAHRGRSVREVLPAMADQIEPLLRRALAGEPIAPAEIDGIAGSAMPRRMLVSYQPAVAPDGRVVGVVVAVQDITALRAAEAEVRDMLRRANAELERRVAERTRQLEAEVRERELAQAQLAQAQKMELIGQLTGGVAHDFNNLLTAIIGNLELALVRSRDLPEVSRLLQGAVRAADRGAALTQRMLAFARRQYLRFEPVADLLATTLGPAIELRLEAQPNIRPARADPNQIEMLLLNLAVNARDAMPRGGRVLVTVAEERVDERHPAGLPPGDYARLSVADSGEGMDAATLARAFEPFFTTKPVGHGSGLGLSMVQGVADQSGGGVAIESAPGAGTTVTVWLPCAEAAEAATPRPAEAAAPMLAAGGHVLLVDDDPDVLAFAATCLEEAGYRVTRAVSGEAALALLRGMPSGPDLLVADVGLPGIGGIQLAMAGRQVVPGLPVLIATGYADSQDPAGISAEFPVLGKPFKAADLLARVAALLRVAA
jgi:PAS domain S-box-containing protein